MRPRSMKLAGFVLLLGLPLLTACKGEEPPPAPVELTSDETGYFCQMTIAEHPGPKAQIHLAGRSQPLFFPSVVDGVAFLMMPGESKAVSAVYVNDMGIARNWTSPEPGTWIDANTAYFVVDSKKIGGMGHKEAVPFAILADAERFVADNSGRIVRLSEIPQSYVFPDAAAVDVSADPPEAAVMQNPKEALQ